MVGGGAGGCPQVTGALSPGWTAATSQGQGRRGGSKLARDDPGMLDLVLGVLFHYDP